MSEDVEPVENSRYTPEQIDSALLALAMTGNSEAAARQSGLKPRTIRHFRSRYPRRYLALAQRHGAEIEGVIVSNARQATIVAHEATMEAIQAERERLRDGKTRDPAAAGRNFATIVGINVDKVLSLTGRPNTTIQHRGDPLKQLTAKGFVEGSAEELHGPELPAGP